MTTSATTATTWRPCSACWAVLKRPTPATHASQYRDGYFWCAGHAQPGDPPLAPVCQGCMGSCCTRCDLPTDPQITESNRRAAERRQTSSSPLDRMEGSGF